MDNQIKNTKNCSAKLRVVSLNVRGLRNAKKRRTLFYSFRKEKYDVICLQETYLDKNDMHLLNKEWGSAFHYSEGTHKSKGLLTLFSKNVNSNEISQVRTTDRSIVSKIKVDENLMIFINVYAPCIISEKIKFLDDISVYVTSQIQEELFLVILIW